MPCLFTTCHYALFDKPDTSSPLFDLKQPTLCRAHAFNLNQSFATQRKKKQHLKVINDCLCDGGQLVVAVRVNLTA